MKNICVFCGAWSGGQSVYADAAKALAQALAARNYRLIYGGGKVGLMGIVADTMLEHGGEVIGVIPTRLNSREVAHTGITELIEVDTMQARKELMIERSDAFISLPGGFGTLDEMFEALTTQQLQYHNKPSGVLNIDGYYEPLIAMLQHMVKAGFVPQKNYELLHVADDADTLLELLNNAT